MKSRSGLAPNDPLQSIREEFGYSETEDERVARLLQSDLSRPPFDVANVVTEATARLRGRPVIIVGAADDAADAVRRSPPAWPLVSADGATTAVLEAGRVPDLIVTDLDGRVEDEVRAVRDGSLVFVHAHGDNENRIRAWLPRFPPERVAGTCQVEPPSPLLNPGGFTDGDRACYLAHRLGASRLRLVGFDYSGHIGRYSGAYDPVRKQAKLRWAKRLLERLQDGGARIEYDAP